jgi:hypothetical protein
MKTVVRSCQDSEGRLTGANSNRSRREKVPNSTREKSNIFHICDKSGAILWLLVPATDDDDEKPFNDTNNDGDRANRRSARLFPLF